MAPWRSLLLAYLYTCVIDKENLHILYEGNRSRELFSHWKICNFDSPDTKSRSCELWHSEFSKNCLAFKACASFQKGWQYFRILPEIQRNYVYINCYVDVAKTSTSSVLGSTISSAIRNIESNEFTTYCLTQIRLKASLYSDFEEHKFTY